MHRYQLLIQHPNTVTGAQWLLLVSGCHSAPSFSRQNRFSNRRIPARRHPNQQALRRLIPNTSSTKSTLTFRFEICVLRRPKIRPTARICVRPRSRMISWKRVFGDHRWCTPASICPKHRQHSSAPAALWSKRGFPNCARNPAANWPPI
jgi:hypothetical protein